MKRLDVIWSVPNPLRRYFMTDRALNLKRIYVNTYYSLLWNVKSLIIINVKVNYDTVNS